MFILINWLISRNKLDEIKRTKEELEQARVDLEGGKYFMLYFKNHRWNDVITFLLAIITYSSESW